MQPILEILIPTYKRPLSASVAIDSILTCNDSRLTVRCNSNGYENDLEKYRNINKIVHYDFFKSNKGPHANILKLLSETEADFCMLLSDEDRINNNNYANLLNYLENIDDSVNVIACSIYDLEKDKFYWRPSSRLSECDINDYVALSPLSTYISGIVYRVKSLRSINISNLMSPSIGNSYPHLDINIHMLLNGKLDFYDNRFVEMGRDVKFGGDGYSHKSNASKSDTLDSKNKDLNPSVYGPQARVRQFYYRENLLNKLKSRIGFISSCIGRFNYLEFYYKCLMNSDRVVILPKNKILKDEALIGYEKSKENMECSGSKTSNFFTTLIRLPKFISALIVIILSNLNNFIRKIYLLHLMLSKNFK